MVINITFYSSHLLLLLPFQYFQKEMPSKFDADPDRVFDEAYGVRLNYKKMKKLEKEYTTMKVKEKEDEIELRVRFSCCFRFDWSCGQWF